jgi:uncharacterized protein YabE (DUF348 family)
MKRAHYLSFSLFLIATGIVLFSIGIRKQVVINLDGKIQSLSTTAFTVKGLLADEKINIGEKDSIQPPPGEWLKDGETVYIEKAARIYLWADGQEYRFLDSERVPADTPLSGPLAARLERSRPLVVRFHNGEIQARSAAKTVGEALNGTGVPLQGLDYSIPPAGDPLPEDGEIRVVRVQEEVALETEPLPFETKTQPLSDLELDRQKIVQPGAYGLSGRRVRIRLDDGKEVSRQIEDSFVVQEPEPRIIGYGTKLISHILNTPSGNLKYWRALNMYTVSYNPTSAGGTITASGLPLAKGVVAVDTRYIPFGTRLYIPGYGIAVAADTGGGVKGRIIDLGYSDKDYVSWHQWVTVYFLWPPPGNVPLIIP